MPRKERPLNRDTGVVRDASLVVIASEDTYAAENYFCRFKSTRVQFRVLPTQEGESSPTHLVDRLRQYRDEFSIGSDDVLWYCGDTDHWVRNGHQRIMSQAIQHCRQAEFRVALSAPCFEVWLLLHFVDQIPDSIKNCGHIQPILSEVSGGYSKRLGLKVPLTNSMVRRALSNAEKLSVDEYKIPEEASTQVHRIVQDVINRGLLELN